VAVLLQNAIEKAHFVRVGPVPIHETLPF